MDVEAGEGAPRGLTQCFSRKHSEVEKFIQLSPDQNIPLMSWWRQASFHAWLLPCRLYGILRRGSPLHVQEHVPGCRVLLHPRCMARIGGAPPGATRLHLLFCVWAPFQRREGAEKDALFPGLIPESSWETVKAQPHRGPVELTIPLCRHSFHEQCSPLCSRHGAGYYAWHFTQISSSLTLLHGSSLSSTALEHGCYSGSLGCTISFFKWVLSFF